MHVATREMHVLAQAVGLSTDRAGHLGKASLLCILQSNQREVLNLWLTLGSAGWATTSSLFENALLGHFLFGYLFNERINVDLLFLLAYGSHARARVDQVVAPFFLRLHRFQLVVNKGSCFGRSLTT